MGFLSQLVFLVLSFQASARETTDIHQAQNLNQAFAQLIQYNGGEGMSSGIVLAQNERGEQVILTSSRNLGRFITNIFSEIIEIRDWTLEGVVDGNRMSSIGRVSTAKNGVLGFNQTVAFYRPRPKFFGSQNQNLNALMPATDFSLVLNVATSNGNARRLNQLYYDGFTKTLDYAEILPGDVVKVAGVSALYPSTQSVSAQGFVASNDKALEILSEKARDDKGRVLPAFDFDAQKEFLVVTSASTKGFSGGGVFNQNGELAGLVTRVGTTESGISFYRVLKIEFILSRLEQVPFKERIQPIVKTVLQANRESCRTLVP
jgi:hypothetical protein